MRDGFSLQVVFFKTDSGNEPVREWLRSLSKTDRKIIGEDVKTVQFSWPIGMPLVRKIDMHLWEIRSQLGNRIARTLFSISSDTMVLLHGFIKKSQKTPSSELMTAKKRLIQLKEHDK